MTSQQKADEMLREEWARRDAIVRQRVREQRGAFIREAAGCALIFGVIGLLFNIPGGAL